MEIIHLSYPIHVKPDSETGPLSLALGFFDGVHKGHQRVIGDAIKQAESKGIKSAVMTFDPHPSLVLGGRKEEVFYITPMQQKMEILEGMGVDYCFIVRFTSEFAKLTPQQFIEIFIKELNVSHVTAGFDFSFGSKGKGDMTLMKELGDGQYGVTVIEKQEDGNEKISSTRIRELLKNGAVEQVCHLLGRPFRVLGTVVNGDKRGRTIGFPTANIEPELGAVVPSRGVYAVKIQVQGQTYNGVCNIGFKPTFNNPDVKKQVIEVHILDFDKSIYGEMVEVEWHERIRDEQKFSGIDELKAQIQRDKMTAEQFFAGIN
ncbi:riboflavin biosynthesis protein RibF [Microbacterium sp. APC 3898]|uniref:Riboflavin biosynthesis protein n=2 Tax=Planococcus TaxID=1372 RepID=A0ABT7ZG89_9BACL|nr:MULTISPECIES: riboflavin biosynthesis protein RibF [Terrabacteria group]MBD8013932.1 riboflavin biosynthesis protein RibF [Planococcus wigleyi]MDN3426172.1 riboflavin biosynthesis protein RibF [Planococcus sp. APC 4016]MDN3437765.1 riboflavin biosynthesis protein RibF [Planococcus sp. APC 3900]MDN3497869.1 riboflavin biosynthesis protein RibF [Microbacterium sp. APC 3898]